MFQSKFYNLIILQFVIILLIIKSNVNGDAISTQPTTTITTSKQCQRADKCALTLIPLTDEKFIEKPPRTSTDMREWCQRIVPMERCLKDYAQKCLNKQSRQTLSVLLFSISRTNKRYCTNKKRQKSFLNYVDCFHPQIHSIANVLRNMTTDFHAIPLVKEKTLRLPLTCCSYYKWKNIGVDKIIKSCPTNTAAHEEAENLLAGYTNDLLAIICGDYVEESDKCEGIIGKIPEWKRPLRWQNFILPLVTIFDSIDYDSISTP
ncbi:hypothetical protein DERP_008458 [Dermatophagoides pteronyssinus]|uniref:Uncharacterized protein n=1 Tax=Dermatophagoides pteronyssinus TaxID=6956 RepID=A0ABQ8IVB6_DERPT|nr:hypothetical protein DERP_008458 [Dermatophagoides pteronyssinus]